MSADPERGCASGVGEGCGARARGQNGQGARGGAWERAKAHGSAPEVPKTVYFFPPLGRPPSPGVGGSPENLRT